MIYYAKNACMIDGHSYNAGDIVPAAVMKTAGDMIRHLVRTEGEPLNTPTATELSNDSTGLSDTEGEDDTDLPAPEQKSDDSTSKDATTTTPTDAKETGSQSTTATSSTPVTGSKTTEVKKETK